MPFLKRLYRDESNKNLRIVTFLKFCSGLEALNDTHSISRGKYCGGRLFQNGCRARISSRVFIGISKSSSFELSPQDRRRFRACSFRADVVNTRPLLELPKRERLKRWSHQPALGFPLVCGRVGGPVLSIERHRVRGRGSLPAQEWAPIIFEIREVRGNVYGRHFDSP